MQCNRAWLGCCAACHTKDRQKDVTKYDKSPFFGKAFPDVLKKEVDVTDLDLQEHQWSVSELHETVGQKET